MVKTIDIHALNLEELNGVVSLYPWYGGARKELCSRMAAMGALTQLQASEAALYVGSRNILSDMLRQDKVQDYTDNVAPSAEPARQIFIAGGDYFSQSEYESVKRSDDNVFSKFATKAKEDGYKEDTEEADNVDFYTETLAQIYLEQDYPEQAKEIYSELSLRYPEKSVYFAALIEKINKNR